MKIKAKEAAAPNMELATRIHHATVEAQSAFWASMVKAFPEIKTGDFSPHAEQMFDAACISATTLWVNANLPNNYRRN